MRWSKRIMQKDQLVSILISFLFYFFLLPFGAYIPFVSLFNVEFTGIMMNYDNSLQKRMQIIFSRSYFIFVLFSLLFWCVCVWNYAFWWVNATFFPFVCLIRANECFLWTNLPLHKMLIGTSRAHAHCQKKTYFLTP